MKAEMIKNALEIVNSMNIFDLVMSYLFVSLSHNILSEKEIRMMRHVIQNLLDKRYTFDDYYDLMYKVTSDIVTCEEAYLDLKELYIIYSENNNDYDKTIKEYKVKSNNDDINELALIHILSLKDENAINLLRITVDVLFLVLCYNKYFRTENDV